METVVYLVRHSETVHKANLKNIVNSDAIQLANEKAFLSVSGEKKAEKLSKNKEFQKIDAVYSSNYVRCLGTAKYFALENNTIIHIDERLNERKIGEAGDLEWKDFNRLQVKDWNFKLNKGESLNQTKKRMIDCMKNILMYESGNRIVVVSHSTALVTLLSAWCNKGTNYDDEIILSYGDKTIVDGRFGAPMVFKVTFDGLSVTNVEYLEFQEKN